MKKTSTTSHPMEDVHDLTHLLKQRDTEISLLSSVQDRIASGASVQELYGVVGEGLRELFDVQAVSLSLFNFNDKAEAFPYVFEEGKTQLKPPRPLNRERQPPTANREQIYRDENGETGKATKEGGSSSLEAPIVSGKMTLGVISIQAGEFQEGFTEHDLRFLTSLAASLGGAIQNAETTRKLQAALTDLESAQQQLVQQEKLASLGQLTAGIAHEIKNPLNFVTNFSELNVELIEEVFEELKKLNGNEIIEEITGILQDVKSNLKKIHQHGDRADGIVKSMLQHSRGGTGKIEPTDLNALIREYVNLSFHGMRAGKKAINVSIDLKLDEKVGMVPLIGVDFSRVILNICNNAFDAMREKLAGDKANYKAKLSVRTQVSTGQVHIHIEDNGPGIHLDHKDKILQPFFTTKKSTEGTGLGLSITHDIIKAHKGTLDIESHQGYTRFIIILPNTR